MPALLDVCTGCGAGAMKGPMKGRHRHQQRIAFGRYIEAYESRDHRLRARRPIVNHS